jgi:hypothetical protein
LRVTGKVNILGTIGDELHQTTTSHLCLYLGWRKKFGENAKIAKFQNCAGEPIRHLKLRARRHLG